MSDDDIAQRLIAFLEAREGQVVAADVIVAALGRSWSAPYRALWVAVSRARDALPARTEILTIREQGYMLRRR